jgi:hypothetical protein
LPARAAAGAHDAEEGKRQNNRQLEHKAVGKNARSKYFPLHIPSIPNPSIRDRVNAGNIAFVARHV